MLLDLAISRQQPPGKELVHGCLEAAEQELDQFAETYYASVRWCVRANGNAQRG